MSDQATMRNLAARVAALRQAMDAIMQGTTPDIGKWSGVNSFVRAYTDLAREYRSLTGDKTVRVYDASQLKSMTWPRQKAWFDTIYAEILILSGALTAHTNAAPSGPLYNLLVSGLHMEWTGGPFQIELSRCVHEYTDSDLYPEIRQPGRQFDCRVEARAVHFCI